MGNALPSLVFADPVAVEVSLCRIVGISDKCLVVSAQ
jgi:hypothetical protein